MLLLGACKSTTAPVRPAALTYAPSTDSIYLVSEIPIQLHNVLVEEFCGQSCSLCPYANRKLDTLTSTFPGRINNIVFYIYGSPQTTPLGGHIYDFRDSAATNIADNIYTGCGFLPAAGIDRTSYGGNLYLSDSSWATDITSHFALSDSATLSVTSSYSTSGSTTTATIITTVTYSQAVTTPQNLNIAIVEDSMIDIQEDNAATMGYDTAYVFTSVFRGMVTSGYAGDPILADTTKVAGMTERKVYTYILTTKTPAINPAHCRVIAFVGSGAPPFTPVWQSQQCKLGL